MGDKDSQKGVSTPRDRVSGKGKDKSHPSELHQADEILRDKEEAMSASETLDCTQCQTDRATDGTTHAGTSRRGRDDQLDRDRVSTHSQISAALASPLVRKANPTIKDLTEVLTSTHAETTFTLCGIQTRMNDFERSLEFNYSKVEENAESIVQLRSENRVLHKTIDDLRHELVKVRTELNVIQNHQDAYERPSREWGIRVHGIQECSQEDTRVVLYVNFSLTTNLPASLPWRKHLRPSSTATLWVSSTRAGPVLSLPISTPAR